MEFGQQFFQQSQSCLRSLGGWFRYDEVSRVKYAIAMGRLVVARLCDYLTGRFVEIGLSHHACQRK